MNKNNEQIHDLQSKVDIILESTQSTRNIIGTYDVLEDGRLQATGNDLDTMNREYFIFNTREYCISNTREY